MDTPTQPTAPTTPAPAKEPLKTDPTGGRPEYSDEQYKEWLNDLEPYLKKGNSLYYCCNRAGLQPHYASVLRKYRLNDWFCQKVDAYRAYPGELANDTIITALMQIDTKLKTNAGSLTKDDIDILKLVAEKHRTAQPFFVTRTEAAVADPDKVGKVLDTIETDYDTVGREAKKQMVATNAPVQDKGQTGPVGDVSA